MSNYFSREICSGEIVHRKSRTSTLPSARDSINQSALYKSWNNKPKQILHHMAVHARKQVSIEKDLLNYLAKRNTLENLNKKCNIYDYVCLWIQTVKYQGSIASDHL